MSLAEEIYGDTSPDFEAVFSGLALTEGDKRLYALLLKAFGAKHQSTKDLVELLFAARSARPPAGSSATDVIRRTNDDYAAGCRTFYVPEFVELELTHEYNGVTYKEASEAQTGGCQGCAFEHTESCADASSVLSAAFGGYCGTRRVVYVEVKE